MLRFSLLTEPLTLNSYNSQLEKSKLESKFYTISRVGLISEFGLLRISQRENNGLLGFLFQFNDTITMLKFWLI